MGGGVGLVCTRKQGGGSVSKKLKEVIYVLIATNEQVYVHELHYHLEKCTRK
jgi:hypothetical protein